MTEIAASRPEREVTEINLLLDGIFRHYGYDFRQYAFASIRRRIMGRAQAEGAKSVLELLERVLDNSACMERLLRALTIHVTSMFRDPKFYIAFREKVVPFLKTYPFVRIWDAGCSSGAEVYSLAILLAEEGIYDRCRIYATDLSEDILRDAKQGMFPLNAMKEYTENYQKAGGKVSFSDYYSARYDHALFQPSLRKNIIFAQHDLVAGGSFNEFNVILCRNVMIYFNRSLQDRVHRLFYQSLARLGVLGLGQRESLRFSPHEASYETVDAAQCLFRKVEL
jgi:chemotaxis protein methyltransferase CheR